MKIKKYLFRKILPFFIKDFLKYLNHMEYYYSDFYYCQNECNFDNLEEFLVYSDKYITEINIAKDWVRDYEYYHKIKE